MRRGGWKARLRTRSLAGMTAAIVVATLAAVPSAAANVAFTRTWGWGVATGASSFEICTSSCKKGMQGSAAGEFSNPRSVAVDGSGNVFVTDQPNQRIEEFSSTGSFTKAWGFGVATGASVPQTCTVTCQAGIQGVAAGQLDYPDGIAIDGTNVFVAEAGSQRIDEFTTAGAFVKAWGWGVATGASQFETCTSTCQLGKAGGGAGQLSQPAGVAVDGAGHVFVGDLANSRIDEFNEGDGSFVRAWGWGVDTGASQFETCTSTCQAGLFGFGAGEFNNVSGVAVDQSAGRLLAADFANFRIDEFTMSGSFVKAFGWGVADGAYHYETCTSTCQAGILDSGAGALYYPYTIGTDGKGLVFVGGNQNERVDEFTTSGSFVRAFGWGVIDGAGHFETCTSTCTQGTQGFGAGEFNLPAGVAADGKGNLLVVDQGNQRIDEFSGVGGLPAPDTKITKSSVVRTKHKATFTFKGLAGVPPYTFMCKLDAAKFVACTSPKTYTRLKAGRHTFKVEAKASGVVDPTPATVTFRI